MTHAIWTFTEVRSFQEYQAARDLADPTNKKRDEALVRYIEGEDWWAEVMAFYVAMSKRPKDMMEWLTNVNTRLKRPR